MENNHLTEAQAREQVLELKRALSGSAPARRAYVEQARDYAVAMNRAKAAEGECEQADRRCEDTRSDLERARQELQSLRGLFTGKRRKELEAQIESLEKRLKDAEQRKKDAERQRDSARAAVPEAPVDPNLPDERETAYRCAGLYRQAGLYADAALVLNGIRDYRDVNVILEQDAEIAGALCAYQAQFEVGNTVTFGRYPQDEDPSAEPKPIEWYVLEKESGRAKLVSKYALDCLPYNEGKEYSMFDYLGGAERSVVTWETCSLRRWLNDEFFKTAFDEFEQARITMVPVKMLRKQGYHTFREQGNDTKDRVFLLGYGEELMLYKLLPGHEASICGPTNYAKKRGGLMSLDKTCDWWLRGVGDNSPNDAMVVYHNGEPNSIGRDSANRKTAVRPAIVVDI